MGAHHLAGRVTRPAGMEPKRQEFQPDVLWECLLSGSDRVRGFHIVVMGHTHPEDLPSDACTRDFLTPVAKLHNYLSQLYIKNIMYLVVEAQ